jgi:tRNA threonylcarbamoyladenosine biosynthesis protein TsaE
VMIAKTNHSKSAAETEAAGRRLAGDLRGGDVVLLVAELAAGKTTLVKGIVEGLGGEQQAVSSPTFVLIQSYDCAGDGIDAVHHVDLYRLDERLSELREIGLEDILSDQTAVIAVEWPKDTMATWIPTDARVWRIAITVEDDDSRSITVTPPRG